MTLWLSFTDEQMSQARKKQMIEKDRERQVCVAICFMSFPSLLSRQAEFSSAGRISASELQAQDMAIVTVDTAIIAGTVPATAATHARQFARQSAGVFAELTLFGLANVASLSRAANGENGWLLVSVATGLVRSGLSMPAKQQSTSPNQGGPGDRPY